MFGLEKRKSEYVGLCVKKEESGCVCVHFT